MDIIIFYRFSKEKKKKNCKTKVSTRITLCVKKKKNYILNLKQQWTLYVCTTLFYLCLLYAAVYATL